MTWKPDYISIDDLKRHLRLPGVYEGTLNTTEDLADDIPLAMAIGTASRMIDQATNRQFGIFDTATALTYTPEYDTSLTKYIVPIDDLMTTSGLIVNYRLTGTGVYDQTTTDYSLYPINASAKGDPWTTLAFDRTVSVPTLPESVSITAKWGWTEVPNTIKQATLLQASRLYKRRDAPFGVAGSPEMGNELRLLAKVDPDVDVAIVPYKRKWGVV